MNSHLTHYDSLLIPIPLENVCLPDGTHYNCINGKPWCPGRAPTPVRVGQAPDNTHTLAHRSAGSSVELTCATNYAYATTSKHTLLLSPIPFCLIPVHMWHSTMTDWVIDSVSSGSVTLVQWKSKALADRHSSAQSCHKEHWMRTGDDGDDGDVMWSPPPLMHLLSFSSLFVGFTGNKRCVSSISGSRSRSRPIMCTESINDEVCAQSASTRL